jgi:nucleoside phosphorylase
LHVTGVGRARATAALEAILEAGPAPVAVLSLGFAGGIKEELRPGDLVLGQRLLAAGEDLPLYGDARLLATAQAALARPGSPRYFMAGTVTVPRMLRTREEKASVHRATQAWAAVMEDYWLAVQAARHGAPFLSVRAVLDTASQELPAFVAGQGDKGKFGQLVSVAANLIVRPRYLPTVLNLSRQVRAAGDSLATFGVSFVDCLDAGASHQEALRGAGGRGVPSRSSPAGGEGR